jgi:hypothetical protein
MIYDMVTFYYIFFREVERKLSEVVILFGLKVVETRHCFNIQNVTHFG